MYKFSISNTYLHVRYRICIGIYKNVIDKNIPLIREWINNVQTVDDAITVLNQRIVTLPHIYVPYMCHIRAFLYAKNNDIDNAIESIKQGYENSEIPQVIIDKLVQIANG